jgi:hypothetical protein
MTPPPQPIANDYLMDILVAKLSSKVTFYKKGKVRSRSGLTRDEIYDCFEQFRIAEGCASHSSAQNEQEQHASERKCNSECPDKTPNCSDTCADYFFRNQPMGILSEQEICEKVLDDFVQWIINSQRIVGYGHIFDTIEKYKAELRSKGGERE